MLACWPIAKARWPNIIQTAWARLCSDCALFYLIAVVWVPVNSGKNCVTTCQARGLFAINGGAQDQAICAHERDTSTYLGEWLQFHLNSLHRKVSAFLFLWWSIINPCVVAGMWTKASLSCNFVDKRSYLWTTWPEETFTCLCQSPTASLEWKPSPSCVAGGGAALRGSSAPAACRIRDGNGFALGWIAMHSDGKAATCWYPSLGSKTAKSAVLAVSGGPLDVEVLCKSGGPRLLPLF